MTKQR